MQGLRLPLTDKQIEDLSKKAEEILTTLEAKNTFVMPPILRAQYINLIHYSLEQLT